MAFTSPAGRAPWLGKVPAVAVLLHGFQQTRYLLVRYTRANPHGVLVSTDRLECSFAVAVSAEIGGMGRFQPPKVPLIPLKRHGFLRSWYLQVRYTLTSRDGVLVLTDLVKCAF